MTSLSRKKWQLDMLRAFYFLRHAWSKLRNNALDLKGVFSEFHEEIWREAAEELSVDLVTYPGGFHRARYGDRSTWIQDYRVQLDDNVMLDIARNKPLVSELLSDRGIAVPPFHAFTFHEMASARDFLLEQGAPCVVKPALDCAGGKGVTTNVRTPRDLARAIIFASAYSHRVMIETQIPGDVYRLLYLDGKLIDAIRRRPPQIIGDGRSTIQKLIRAENKRRAAASGRSALKVLAFDFDCSMTLRRAGLSLKSVPEKDAAVVVKSTTNESAAHECDSAMKVIDLEVVREGSRAATELGIRLAGVDVITDDISVPLERSGGAIIEVNAAPGLQYHYQISPPEDIVPVAVPILRYLLHINEGDGESVPDRIR